MARQLEGSLTADLSVKTSLMCCPPAFSGQCHTCRVCKQTGSLGQEIGPSTGRLGLHLQQEWDHITWPGSPAYFSMGEGLLDQWHSQGGAAAHVANSNSHKDTQLQSPFKPGRAVCPCELTHDHSDVAAEWDWEGNRTGPQDCGARERYQGSHGVVASVGTIGALLQPL